jgi:hypothetical protein
MKTGKVGGLCLFPYKASCFRRHIPPSLVQVDTSLLQAQLQLRLKSCRSSGCELLLVEVEYAR